MARKARVWFKNKTEKAIEGGSNNQRQRIVVQYEQRATAIDRHGDQLFSNGDSNGKTPKEEWGGGKDGRREKKKGSFLLPLLFGLQGTAFAFLCGPI